MKKILLAISGTTPQIITETIYALWEQNNMPDAIYILTTQAGKDRLYNELLCNGQGYFYAFCKEYDIDSSKIDFKIENILVPCNYFGESLKDIRTEEDSTLFLQLCLEQTFKLTSNSEDKVFFSIAGGRKTMGASLTLATQYYGRKHDRLFHLLIQSEFEYSKNFYYPPKKPVWIELKDQKNEPIQKSTEFAKITLTRIPFFSVRDRLSESNLKSPVLPQEILSQIDIISTIPFLRLHYRTCTIEWNNKTIKMQPVLFALYVYFAKYKKEACYYDEFVLSFEELEKNSQKLIDIYYEICKYIPQKEIPKSSTGILNMSVENFNSSKAKINKELKKAFGTSASKDVCIASFGKKLNMKFGINLQSDHIEINKE